MKRLFLEKIVQGKTVFYVGKADPRDLVKMATKIEIGEVQDAQRPLNGRRVKEIAKYVGEDDGMLATSIVLATNTPDKLVIKQTNATTSDGVSVPMYYIEIPTTKAEFSEYENTIDVMDGQHRLYSFADDYRSIKDDVEYEVSISLFICPTTQERRLVFKNTNEKQEKVSNNLLMWFREKLGLLAGKEKTYYGLVSMLNTENASPLKGRIIMSAETVKYGIKATQLINVLDKAKIDNIIVNGQKLSDQNRLKMICTYLSAWEKVCGIDYNSPNPKVDGAATKMAGIRFVLLLLPTFWDKAITTQSTFNEAFIVGIINQLMTSSGYCDTELFTHDNTKGYYVSETATTTFAEHCEQIIKGLDNQGFNPLA